MSDNINPTHYRKVPGVECIEVTQHFNFNRGNAIKYIWRAGEKDKSKEVEDLQKALWYIEKEIDRVTKEKKMYEIKKQSFTFWHGLGLGLIIAILAGIIISGFFGQSNSDLARYRKDLEREQELNRVLSETSRGLERNLTLERIANKDIRRDYSRFIDLVEGTIEHVNSQTGDTITKLRGVIEALKVISNEIRDIRRFIVD